MRFPRICLLAIFFFICRVCFVSCVTLELYSGPNYSYFLKKVIVDKDDEHKCIMPGDWFTIRSIKTDKCVILYQNPNCYQTPIGYPDSLYSYRVDKNTDHFDIREDFYKENMFGDKQQEERVFMSFHVCSDEQGGGGALNIDMYARTHYWAHILKSWKGVCKCENIPSSMYHKVHSINNHGNSVYVFNKKHCRGDSTLIPAGDSEASRNVGGSLDGRFDIRSFRPVGPFDCLKLDASIYKFTFLNGWRSGEPLQKHVQMASTQTLTNNGVLPITKTIEFSKTVGNSVEYSVANAFTQIHSVRVAKEVETETLAGISLVGELKLKLSLEANYQYTKKQQQTKTSKTAVSDTETVRATTTVQVAGCEKCDVTGYITIVRDFPINYTAYAVVKGIAGEDRLTAGEIRDYLPQGMEYVKDHDDEYSALVSVEGSMQAELPLKTFVAIDCMPVPNCDHHHQNEPKEKTHEIYDVPFVVEVHQEKNFSCGKSEFWMPNSSTCERRESSN